MRLSEEQIERASTVNLPQFLMQNGFDLKRVGREYVWKDHDSMHIKDNTPGERGVWHRFSTDEGGDNIAFLRQYMNMSFVEAVEALNGEHYDRTYTPPQHTHTERQQKVQAQELVFSEADNAKRVFAYLCKTRGLDYELVKSLIQSGAVAQEQKTGNVLFKFTDEHGKTVGAEKVGTSTEHKFKGVATGSAGGYGFEVCRGNGSHLLFFESSIDMLSYLQMHQSELDDHRLVSMMGVKPQTVIDTMERYGISPDKVYLCSDNDRAGNEFAERLMTEYPDMKRIVTPDTYKDWNDMLRGIPKKEIDTEQKTEVKKEADRMAVGNRYWHNATSNADKVVATINADDFQRIRQVLDDSTVNYFPAKGANGTLRIAMNESDVPFLRSIAGNVPVVKSSIPYDPPEKNIIGNAKYRYIPNKEYISADCDLILKMAGTLDKQGIKFSGKIYPTGKGTLTVNHDDLAYVRSVRDNIIGKRRQVGIGEKGQVIGNRSVSAQSRHLYMSTLTPKQYEEVKPFIETNARYSGVIRDGKVMFSVDRDEAQVFHRALDTAKREVGLIHTMQEQGLPMEQMIALSPVMHRLAVEDVQLQLSDFFDKRYDEAQFGEMLSLVNAYLDQPASERYGEHSKLNDMLEAKSSFDRTIELSDFFSQHDFSEEQKSAIATMFVGEVTRGQIDSIDETFTAEDIQAYDEILHNALQESDVADFLTAHKQSVLASHDNIDRENTSRVPTEEEVLFPKADLAKFLAERTLSSDEWEDMAYPLFDSGYLDKHKPSDKAAFGYHLSEPALYDLAQRYHDGEDIRRELALGLLEGSGAADIEFIFEQGEISDRIYYYAENLRHSLHLEWTDDGYNCSFGGMERFVSLEEIGQAFLDRTHEEFEDLAFWWVRDDMLDAIPDISDEKIADLLTAFDGVALHGWETGDNQPKLNRIKKALHDILGDETQTEKAFAIIAKKKYNVTFEPERKPDSLEFQFGYSKDGNDRWFTESGLLSDFAEKHGEISFALANALMEYLDDKQHKERMIPDLNAGYYKKTNFEIRAVVDGQEFNFSNRFDIGDGKGSGGGSLIDHIRTICENAVASTAYPYNTPESKETPRNMLNVLVPYLEAHSTLTAEEQKILDDFKEKNPIRTIDDVEKAQGKFQIYQLPSGEKHHSVRFEGLDRLKAEGVQLNKDDYELVYEGLVGEFRGNATLEGIFTQFNTNQPADFTGHSLSVSDVIVISVDDKDTAYYCDSFGFTEMPEFFLEKEKVQEMSAPSVANLAVGDIIMYDGARREIEEISADRIKMKDLDTPDYGGILLGTSDVLAYDGWQRDMEEKGFEILSKAEKPVPAVDTPEQAEPEDKGPVSIRKVGDFYEMYGKNAKVGEEVLGLRMTSKNGQPMVGFPYHVKDDYSEKLRKAGYSVLMEEAFEINPPKREAEKLQTLQQVVDKFFGTDCESAETEGGTWKLAIADGEKVGELFYGGEPVCCIYNRCDKMEIEPYRELTTFQALLRTAMLEHNPDKPVEIMDFQRTFETPLDKAKFLINDFCEAEYREGADFDDLHNVGLAFTTLTDDELPIQVTADLVDFKITYEFDGEVYNTEQYDSIEDMIENGLTDLDFSDLVSVTDEVIERHTGKDEQTVELMSDAADVSDTSSPADDVPAVTLKYKGDAESLDEIKDKALSLGATVIIDNAEDVISIDTYENHKAELDNLAYELGVMSVDDVPVSVVPVKETEEIDDDAPLFADNDVIEQIQADEKADIPFWQKPDIEGKQLSLFGDPEPIWNKAPDKAKSEFAPGPVVDGVQVFEALAAEINRGTGFVNGKIRVQEFYEKSKGQPNHPTIQELADFLKKEYGIGGHSGEGNISLVDYDIKGMTFSFENGEKFRHSWHDVAVMTESRLKGNTYLSPEQQEQWQAMKAERSAEENFEPYKVEIGDKFCNKATGVVSEVVSLTGALPYYTDDCTVKRLSGAFEITENISYDKLLNSGLYEYIGRNEPEKEQSAPVKPEKAEVTPDNSAVAPEAEKPEIPTVKNLSQLKKALKPGMMFEITDHLRPECIGERRIVTGVSTVDFTSRKLNENGEPTGKDIHMEFDRAKNWTFDGGELTSRLDNGDMLMSFHFIDSLERTKEQELAPETTAPELSVGDYLEYKGKEYKVESLDENGFITLNNTAFEGAVKDRVTFIADEFLSNGDFKIFTPEKPKEEVTAPEKGENFTITDDNLGDGGAKSKFRANVEAIRTLKTLESEKRPATAEEKETLSRYVGWGAIPQAFDKSADKWSAEYKELSELLTPEEYRQARSTVGDAFYTSPTIIEGIYEALGNFGFEGGNVLEPAMGVGNFFGCMPKEMQDSSHLYGVEIDSISGRIAQALYPDADIAISGFEKNSFQNGCFDVAVGNVPFGELGFKEMNPIKVHPKKFYSTFCGSRMFLFSASPFSRNL